MDLASDVIVALLTLALYAACYFYGYYRGAAVQNDRHLAAWDALQKQLLAQSQQDGLFVMEVVRPGAIKRLMN